MSARCTCNYLGLGRVTPPPRESSCHGINDRSVIVRKRHGRSSGMRLGWRSSWWGVRTPVRLSVQGPAGEVPATAPFSSPPHHWYRRWMGGVSRPHSFVLSTVHSIPMFFHVSQCPLWGPKKAMHQAQHTCSGAPRRRYCLASPEPHFLLIVLLGLRPGGFEPLSSGQQPAAQPLRYMARKLALCITALMNETPEPLSLNRRLGLRPPHSSHNLPRHTGCIDKIQGGSGLGLVHVSTLRH